MVHPIRKPSSEALQSAIFDYLNLNRHKLDERGTFDPTPDERDYVPRELVKYQPGSAVEYEATGAEADDAEGSSGVSQALSKAGACAVEVLPEFAIAASLLGLGAGTIAKPFVTPRSAPKTSIASKYIAPLIPGQFPKRVWTPRLGNPRVFAKSIGRAVARWIPGLGWALLAHDAYRFGDCMLRDERGGGANPGA
ncbi:MAG: hypothetical protein ACREEP_01885 [Dongiaceae bacterium]